MWLLWTQPVFEYEQQTARYLRTFLCKASPVLLLLSVIFKAFLSWWWFLWDPSQLARISFVRSSVIFHYHCTLSWSCSWWVGWSCCNHIFLIAAAVSALNNLHCGNLHYDMIRRLGSCPVRNDLLCFLAVILALLMSCHMTQYMGSHCRPAFPYFCRIFRERLIAIR